MKKPLPQIFIFISAFLTLLFIAANISGESGAPIGDKQVQVSEQNWIIQEDDSIVRENQTIYLMGNLNVRGQLSFTNVKLVINSSYEGEHGITVSGNGRFLITDDSVIKSGSEKNYAFKFNADNKGNGFLEIRDSVISGCGYKSTVPEKNGLYMASNNFLIQNSIFRSNYIGLNLIGADSFGAISGCEFIDNHKAVSLEAVKNGKFENNVISGNFFGIKITGESGEIIISHNRFENNVDSLILTNTSSCTVSSNTFQSNQRNAVISDNNIGIFITENQIENTGSDTEKYLGTGIRVRECENAVVSSNRLSNNDIGLFSLYNNSNSRYADNTLTKGILGMYLYDENLFTEFINNSVTDTIKSAVSINHCSGLVFENLNLRVQEGFMLNVTSSDISVIESEFQGAENYFDSKSRITTHQNVRVRTQDSSGNPLKGSQLKVIQNGFKVYASGDYSGTDNVTNKNGYSGTFPVITSVFQGEDFRNAGKTENTENTKLLSDTIHINASWNGLEKNMRLDGSSMEGDVVPFPFDMVDIAIKEEGFNIEFHGSNEENPATVTQKIENLGTGYAVTDLSFYHILGRWSPGLNIETKNIVLPEFAEKIFEIEVRMEGQSQREVTFEWTPKTKGDHTIAVLADGNLSVVELRENNNLVLSTFRVTEDQLPKKKIPIIEMNVLSNKDENDRIFQGEHNITLSLKNQGNKQGSVVLHLVERTVAEDLLVYKKKISIEKQEERIVNIPLHLEKGVIRLNLSMVPEGGQKAIKILEPYISFIFQVVEKPGNINQPSNNGGVSDTVVYSATAGTITIFLLLFGLFETARYRFLLLFVPLYMRLSKKDIVEQYTRGEILGYIKHNPGESYNNIKRDLNMSNGKLAYHLSVLEKGHFIRSVTDGMYRRYYAKGTKVTTYGRITSVQEEILRRIEETPGITQKDLAKLVDLSTATINYHIRKLKKKELIISKRSGIFVNYYLNGMTVEEIMCEAISSKGSAH